MKIPTIEELAKHSRESRLNLAEELLRNLVPDYEGFQGRLIEALRLLGEIPR